jgi:hypothetical protein
VCCGIIIKGILLEGGDQEKNHPYQIDFMPKKCRIYVIYPELLSTQAMGNEYSRYPLNVLNTIVLKVLFTKFMIIFYYVISNFICSFFCKEKE